MKGKSMAKAKDTATPKVEKSAVSSGKMVQVPERFIEQLIVRAAKGRSFTNPIDSIIFLVQHSEIDFADCHRSLAKDCFYAGVGEAVVNATMASTANSSAAQYNMVAHVQSSRVLELIRAGLVTIEQAVELFRMNGLPTGGPEGTLERYLAMEIEKPSKAR